MSQRMFVPNGAVHHDSIHTASPPATRQSALQAPSGSGLETNSPAQPQHSFSALSIYPNAADTTSTNATGIPDGVLTQMQNAFSTDFSAVRIHEDTQPESLGAVAFTHGHDLHFRPGTFQPRDAAGLEVLGHELAHVVQQREGRTAQAVSSDSNAPLEREAAERGHRAAHGERVSSTVAATATAIATPAVQCLLASVEFEENIADNKWYVSKSTMERGEGTAGGDHSTAFSMFMDAAVNVVGGLTFDEAVSGLKKLAENVLELPNYKSADINDKDKKAVDQKLSDFLAHDAIKDPSKVPDMKKVTVLQNLMVEYVRIRNAVPGTYFNKKSTSTVTGTEKSGINTFAHITEAYEKDSNHKDPGGQETKKLTKAYMQTFDLKSLPSANDVNNSSGCAGVGTLLKNHYMTVEQSYPEIPQDKLKKAYQTFLDNVFEEQYSKLNKSKNSDFIALSTV